PSVADHPLRSATHRCLGELLSHQLANATRAHLLATARRAVFHFFFRRRRILFGISTSFPVLFRTIGRLPTCYSPIRRSFHRRPPEGFCLFPALDLHVLGTPPAFVLSQDQTLHRIRIP